MDVQATAIPEVKVITPRRFGDHRGFFAEVYNRRALAAAGIDIEFVQDNQACSAAPGTLRGLHFQKPPAAQTKLLRVVRGRVVDVAVDLRGLHFQKPPAAQTKLLRVVRGRVVDVAVDLRSGSPTFGRHVMVELSAEAGNQILCPKGFAHGILTLEPDTEVTYKVDAYFAPDLDTGVRFDDPDLAIAWPIPVEQIILSDKDRSLPWLRDLPAIFPYP